MSNPVTAKLVGFEDLRYSDDCVPEYRDKVALTFVVTPDDARRFRLSSEWTLAEVTA